MAGGGVLGAQVEVDFGAGTAGSGVAHLPEVVLLVETEDTALFDAGNLLPKFFRLVIFAKDRDVELFLGHAVGLGDQLPGEVNCLGLEVVAEAEIAHHLEERVVAAGVADVFEIVVLAAGADAFLGGGGARVVAFLLAQEDVLELIHARVGKQQRGVVVRHERGGAHRTMSAGGKKVKKGLADFVAGHGKPLFSHGGGN